MKTQPLKVFVNWDPLFERVICVHKTEEGVCEKCEAIQERAIKESCYFVEGDWFEVLD